jgi:rhodanese-related sulfurtransferase
MAIKLLFDPSDGTILGAQAVGGEGVDKRIDVIATAIRAGMKAQDLLDLELAYAPPFASAKDPVNMLGYIADNRLNGSLKTVQWHEVADLVAQGAVLVDVRSQWETSRGMIPGAVAIPLNSLRERLADLPKDQRVILYCRVGQTAHTGTLLLRNLGIDAFNLDGGYLTWAYSPAGSE